MGKDIVVRHDFSDPSENIKLPDINYEIQLIATESFLRARARTNTHAYNTTATILFHEILRSFNYVTAMPTAFLFVALAVITDVVKQSC